MFESLKETLQALQNKDNATSNNETNEKAPGIEPSADMLPNNQRSQTNMSGSQVAPVATTVDQTLQSSEEAFFETIDQV